MFKRLIGFWANHQASVTIAVLVMAVLYPLMFGTQYMVNIGVQCLLYSILALSLNFITGYTGIVVLGQAGFYGIGAYTTAILLTKVGISFWLAVLCSMGVAFLFGFLIGLPTLKIKGNYLAIVTLGFCEILRIIELNWTSLTNGPFGIKQIPPPRLFGYEFKTPVQKYYLVLVLTALVITVINNLVNSRSGRAWRAIKGDDIAAQAMGVNVTRYKVLAFAISAAIAGLAGAFYATRVNYIDSTTFNYNQSILILSMTIIGGLGSIPGSIIGATFFVILPELLRGLSIFFGDWIVNWRQPIYGIILVVMIMFKSDGLLGGFDMNQIKLFSALHKKTGENPAETGRECQ